MKKNQIIRLVVSAMLLALGLVLPFLTGQIPEVGSRLLPLHLPALICGFVCGWPWGLTVGFVLPILPTGLAIAFEMAAYGAAAGVLYARTKHVIVSLVGAMIVGRVVWGAASWLIYALFMQTPFSIAMFWAGGFVNAWPGMILQLVLVPAIMGALKRAKLIPIHND